MPYVLETIDSDERKRELASLRLRNPLTSSFPVDPHEWLVDRARGHYFISFGGGSFEIPYIFGIADKQGQFLEAYATHEARGLYAPKSIDIHWRVSDIRIAARVAAQTKALIEEFRGALLEYGMFGEKDVVRKATIDFSTMKLGRF